MSISVKNSDGSWLQVAGQGRAEYGASTVRTGTVTFTALVNSWNVVEITFDTPMPDDDYLVIFESTNVAYVHVQQVMSKTINGFNAIVWNRDELTSSHPGYIKYTAFKLYTDTEYNKVLSAIPIKQEFMITPPPATIPADTYIDTGVSAEASGVCIVSINVYGYTDSIPLYIPQLTAMYTFTGTNGVQVNPLATSTTCHNGTCNGTIAIKQGTTGTAPKIQFKLDKTLDTVEYVKVTKYIIGGMAQ